MDLTTTLPDELLARIFACVQAFDPVDYRSDGAQAWVRVTLVCRRWRQIAIAEATLWTRWTPDVCRYGGGLDLFAERSKGASLDILNNDYRGRKEALELLASLEPNIERIRALSVDYQRGEDYDLHYDTVRILTENSFDSLVSCHLKIHELGEDDIDAPLRLFSGLAPRLQHLLLRLPELPLNVLDWTSPIFDWLRSLDLTMLRERYLTDTDDIVSALRRMTRLSSLAIEHWEDCDTHRSDDDSDSEDTNLSAGVARKQPRYRSGNLYVVLPRLELFVVVARPDYFRRLLTNISIPPTASVALASRLRKHNALSTQDYTAISQSLISNNRTAVVAPYRAAYLAFHTRLRDCLILKLTHQHLPSTIYPGHFPHSVFEADNRHHHDNYDLSLGLAQYHIANFLPHLPVNNVTMLTSSTLDVRLLQPFSAVTHLRILGLPDGPTLSTLYGPKDLFLPNLQEIDFHDVRSLKDLFSCFKFGSRGTWHHFWILERIFSGRKYAGHPITRVYVHVQDDVELVKEGRLRDVGFGKWKMNRMHSALALLDEFAEVCVVGKDVDVFMTEVAGEQGEDRSDRSVRH